MSMIPKNFPGSPLLNYLNLWKIFALVIKRLEAKDFILNKLDWLASALKASHIADWEESQTSKWWGFYLSSCLYKHLSMTIYTIFQRLILWWFLKFNMLCETSSKMMILRLLSNSLNMLSTLRQGKLIWHLNNSK